LKRFDKFDKDRRWVGGRVGAGDRSASIERT